MFIHFEDWTHQMFLRKLDAKGMPHAGRIIKAYATPHDPREFIVMPNLVVLDYDHTPFTENEVYP